MLTHAAALDLCTDTLPLLFLVIIIIENRLVIESRESNRNGYEGDGAVLVGTLNLVDLAGSESVKHTGAIGQRAKEGGKINQSLLSLSRVIHALSQPGVHVNFRDSKLTRLLQPSLSGDAKMSIVCCITPASHYLEETRSTLQFASRAKLVETHATVNEVLDDSAQIRRLKREVEELRACLREKEALDEKVRRLEEDNAAKNVSIAATVMCCAVLYERTDERRCIHRFFAAGDDRGTEGSCCGTRRRLRISSGSLLQPCQARQSGVRRLTPNHGDDVP